MAIFSAWAPPSVAVKKNSRIKSSTGFTEGTFCGKC